MPGSGPLAERVEAFQSRFTIPREKLKPVFDAAIAECRARTLQHIPLPKKENFDLAFVTGKSWSGYNYYQGGYRSRIEVNTDLPIRISRAVDLGCHEGYPGHHVLNGLLEQHLAKGRGWIEYSVYPLYSPQSLLAEGSANYGIELAFPGREKLAYEVKALYPIAGIPTADAKRYDALQDAMKDLAGARFTIARELLEGRIDEAEAARLTQSYLLVSPERARQLTDFTKQYRSYVINYGLGLDMVRADVEAAGPTAAARWKRMEQLLSEPTLPADLRAGGRTSQWTISTCTTGVCIARKCRWSDRRRGRDAGLCLFGGDAHAPCAGAEGRAGRARRSADRLCGQGQSQSGGAVDPRARRAGRRHRLDRRISRRTRGRNGAGHASSFPASARPPMRWQRRLAGGLLQFNLESSRKRTRCRSSPARWAWKRRSRCASIPMSRREPTPRSRPARPTTSSAFRPPKQSPRSGRLRGLPGLKVTGVTVHIGSQLTSLAPLETAFTRLGMLIAELRARGIRPPDRRPRRRPRRALRRRPARTAQRPTNMARWSSG